MSGIDLPIRDQEPLRSEGAPLERSRTCLVESLYTLVRDMREYCHGYLSSQRPARSGPTHGSILGL